MLSKRIHKKPNQKGTDEKFAAVEQFSLNDPSIAIKIKKKFNIDYEAGYVNPLFFNAISLKPVHKLQLKLSSSSSIYSQKFFGVETKIDIPNNVRLLQYTGDAIDKLRDKNDSYAVQFKNGFVDALFKGSFGRWLNHSDTPNCDFDIDDSGVYIKTISKVEGGQNLTLDYGMDYKGFFKKVYLNPNHTTKSLKQIFDENKNKYSEVKETHIIYAALKNLLNIQEGQKVFVPKILLEKKLQVSDKKNQMDLILVCDEKEIPLENQLELTIFMLACYLGDIENIKRLLPSANNNYQTDDGRPAIVYLILSPFITEDKKIEIITQILAKDPNFNYSLIIKDYTGKDAIDYCFLQKHNKIIDALLKLDIPVDVAEFIVTKRKKGNNKRKIAQDVIQSNKRLKTKKKYIRNKKVIDDEQKEATAETLEDYTDLLDFLQDTLYDQVSTYKRIFNLVEKLTTAINPCLKTEALLKLCGFKGTTEAEELKDIITQYFGKQITLSEKDFLITWNIFYKDKKFFEYLCYLFDVYFEAVNLLMMDPYHGYYMTDPVFDSKENVCDRSSLPVTLRDAAKPCQMARNLIEAIADPNIKLKSLEKKHQSLSSSSSMFYGENEVKSHVCHRHTNHFIRM